MKSSHCSFTLLSFASLALAILLTHSSAISISPLRSGRDSRTNDILIKYTYEQSNQEDSRYQLFFNPGYQSNSPFISFCFLEQQIVQMQADNFNCDLNDKNSYYDCLTIEASTTEFSMASYSYLYWQMDTNRSAISNFTQFTPFSFNTSTAQLDTIIDLKGTIDSQPFDYLPTPNAFYRVLTTDSRSFDTTYKINYLLTFASTFNKENNKSSDNVLLQRFPYCYLYNKDGLSIYNLIFVGGVVRDSVQTYMMSFVHFEVSRQPFQMWGGLAFSSDKASRDMIGFRPKEGIVEDLYCLFARAPWTDISPNIGGTQDLASLYSSSQISQKNASWFYQNNIARPYITNDTEADEDLFFKINNKYCYVMHARREITTGGVYTYLDNSQGNMHGVPQCYKPSLVLSDTKSRLAWLLVILLLVLAS